jgi:hypothetical protein
MDDLIPVFDELINCFTYDKYNELIPEHLLCKDAANLALIGNELFTLLAQQLWEHIEPGCAKIAANVHAKALARWKKGHFEMPPKPPELPTDVNSDSKVIILRQVCKDIGCKSATTKAQLWENIQKHIEEKNAEYEKKVAIAIKRPKLSKNVLN